MATNYANPEIKGHLKHLQELFDIAYYLNKSEDTRTTLTQLLTEYIPGIIQTLDYFRDDD